MRSVLRLFIRIVTTAGWLSLCAVAQAKAQKWQVTMEPWQDSLMTVRIDTDRESAFCASGTIDHEARIIHLEQVIKGDAAQAFDNTEGVGVRFACPINSIIIHVHLATRGHPHGPSQGDLYTLQHLPYLPPAAIVVYLLARGHAEYLPYGVR